MGENIIRLEGQVFHWNLGGVDRPFINVTLPFRTARALFKPDIYSALSGQGEQRAHYEPHVRKLAYDMSEGAFTPCGITVGTRQKHRDALQYAGENNSLVLLECGPDTPPLPLLNGNHRYGALNKIRERLMEELQDKCGEPNERFEEIQAELDLLDNLPITAMVLLNGNTKDDFLNLQKGKPVDTSHILSLQIQQHLVSDKDAPYYELGMRVAKLLYKREDSPFHNKIRFDTRTNEKTLLTRLPINTLMGKGGSDLGTSLYGLAKIVKGVEPADDKMKAEDVADLFVNCLNVVKEFSPEVFELGKVLTPPPEGTKGSATMLVGLVNIYAYCLGTDSFNENDFVGAVKEVLNEEVDGNFSGPIKRKLLGKFAKAVFKNVDVPKHSGVPVRLIELLSASTLGVQPLPKKRGRPKKVVVTTETPSTEATAAAS